MPDAEAAPDAPVAPATPPGEVAAPAAKDEGQDGKAQLQEVSSQLSEMTARLQATEKDRDEARDVAKREEAIRKGLQRETTAKLQEYARLKQQMETSSISDGKLDRLERLVMVSLEQQLDPETKQKVLNEIDVERLRKENESLRTRNQPQQQAQPAGMNPQYKRDLKDYYFREYDVDPQDPRIDWANDGTVADASVWYQRVKESFERIAGTAQATAKTQSDDLAATIARQVEEATKKLREEYDSKLTEAKTESEKLKAEAEETKRVADEAAKRKKGTDRETSPAAAAAQPPKRFSDVPTDWVYDPEKRKEVQAMLNDKNLRDTIVREAAAARKR